MQLRPPKPDELPALSSLCLRSKAHWGYDAAFMAACADELTFSAEELESTEIQVAADDAAVFGVVQVALATGDAADPGLAILEKLFVDPAAMGTGVGRQLYAWALHKAGALGARVLDIDADPEAAPFYQRMGARLIGTVPSESIPGRYLPHLRHALF